MTFKWVCNSNFDAKRLSPGERFKPLAMMTWRSTRIAPNKLVQIASSTQVSAINKLYVQGGAVAACS